MIVLKNNFKEHVICCNYKEKCRRCKTLLEVDAWNVYMNHLHKRRKYSYKCPVCERINKLKRKNILKYKICIESHKGKSFINQKQVDYYNRKINLYI